LLAGHLAQHRQGANGTYFSQSFYLSFWFVPVSRPGLVRVFADVTIVGDTLVLVDVTRCDHILRRALKSFARP
jgi:hypothetical protein